MMLSLSALVFSLGCPLSLAQDSGSRIEDVIRSYQHGILKIEGVKEIVPDKAEGKDVITVRAETADARDTVLLMTQGKLGGFPVQVVLSSTPLRRPEGPKTGPAGESAGPSVCGHCRAHCPAGPEAGSVSGARGGKETPPPPDPKKKPEPVCTHCPLHCKAAGDQDTVAEPAPVAPPRDSATTPGTPNTPAKPEPQCDVARRLLGLPLLKSGRTGCEEMLSTSNNPERIAWAIEKSLPHWQSKEMPGVKGSSKDGVPCPLHGSHSISEFVCYSWVRHGKSCPMKDILSPKDLVPQEKK